MRNIQNIVSNLGNLIVSQGNALVASIESLRSLRALSQSTLSSTALRRYLSLALRLGDYAWQGPAKTWSTALRTTGIGFAATLKSCVKQAAVVKHDPQRHLIMCHCTAA